MSAGRQNLPQIFDKTFFSPKFVEKTYIFFTYSFSPSKTGEGKVCLELANFASFPLNFAPKVSMAGNTEFQTSHPQRTTRKQPEEVILVS